MKTVQVSIFTQYDTCWGGRTNELRISTASIIYEKWLHIFMTAFAVPDCGYRFNYSIRQCCDDC